MMPFLISLIIGTNGEILQAMAQYRRANYWIIGEKPLFTVEKGSVPSIVVFISRLIYADASIASG